MALKSLLPVSFNMWLLEYFNFHVVSVIFLLGDAGLVNNSMLRL